MAGPDERDAPHFLQQERWDILRREQQAASADPPGPDEVTRRLRDDAARFRDEAGTLDEAGFTNRALDAIGAGADPAADAPPAVTWRWHDHWHQGPPPGWDGRHEITVRGHWQNCDAAGVTLACSCGREADTAMPPAYGTDGEISLAGLNEIARAHQEDAAPPVTRGCAR